MRYFLPSFPRSFSFEFVHRLSTDFIFSVDFISAVRVLCEFTFTSLVLLLLLSLNWMLMNRQSSPFAFLLCRRYGFSALNFSIEGSLPSVLMIMLPSVLSLNLLRMRLVSCSLSFFFSALRWQSLRLTYLRPLSSLNSCSQLLLLRDRRALTRLEVGSYLKSLILDLAKRYLMASLIYFSFCERGGGLGAAALSRELFLPKSLREDIDREWWFDWGFLNFCLESKKVQFRPNAFMNVCCLLYNYSQINPSDPPPPTVPQIIHLIRIIITTLLQPYKFEQYNLTSYNITHEYPQKAPAQRQRKRHQDHCSARKGPVSRRDHLQESPRSLNFGQQPRDPRRLAIREENESTCPPLTHPSF